MAGETGDAIRRAPSALRQYQALRAFLESAPKLQELGRRKHFGELEILLRRFTSEHPSLPAAHCALAVCQARQGKTAAALARLGRAMDAGQLAAPRLEQDPGLAWLRTPPSWPALAEGAELPATPRAPTAPAAAANGVVVVGPGNSTLMSRGGVFLQSAFRLPTAPAGKVVLSEDGKGDEIARQLNCWSESGTAAGLHNILYDNHDADHSNMHYGKFPQLTRIEYGPEAKQLEMHRGLQDIFVFSHPTIGNSSMACGDKTSWRSLPRHAMCQSLSISVQYVHYTSNHLYVYPEHMDYDPRDGGKGHGDVYPANTPMVLISQGSSGSDRPFLFSLACTIAAFQPATQARLLQTRLLAPTLQMIFRRSNRGIDSWTDYMTGEAHPPVFSSKSIQLQAMVTMAHQMASDRIPPLVQLRVEQETLGRPGIDYFERGPQEKLFDLPVAVSRLVRSTAYEKRMVVSAEGSKDPNGLPLTFYWKILCGDESRISITPMNPQGSVAELRVGWHERRPIRPEGAMLTSRVDIGVFVSNGTYHSAPGIVSLHYLASEERVYDEKKRIKSVVYRPSSGDAYADPALHSLRVWRDDYRYGEDGKLLGWQRTRQDSVEDFTAAGRLILAKDADGAPARTCGVRYVARQRERHGPFWLEQEPAAAP